MSKTTKVSTFVCLISVWFLCSAIIPAFSQEENRVRAKIGIQIKSGDRVVQAKARDQVKAGDLIRIYVHPEMSSRVYVVHTDQKKVRLLNITEQRIHSSTLVLPSLLEAYAVDGKSPEEAFTIICSPKEIKELTAMRSAAMPYEKWAVIEKDLMERSKIEMPSQAERPFPILGNVRSDSGGDPFLNEIPIFSGRSFLVKKYEFKVKK